MHGNRRPAEYSPMMAADRQIAFAGFHDGCVAEAETNCRRKAGHAAKEQGVKKSGRKKGGDK